jgi:hypothetical protein
MFKNVEYVGFERQLELKAKAERLTPVLAGEVGGREGEIEVRWAPHSDPHTGVLDLTLSRTLENGVSATHTGAFATGDFARDWDLRWRCRRVWDDLLGVLLDKQHQRVQEAILEPTEA